MYISSYWLRSRLNIFYSFSIDIILFFTFFIFFGLNELRTNIILFNLIFLFIWLLSSYIVGRYHQNYINFLDIFKHIFFSLINFFIFFSFAYFFYYKYLELQYSNGFSQNFYVFLKYIFVSFIFQYIFKKLFRNKFKFYQKWLFLGNKKTFDNCVGLTNNFQSSLVLTTEENLLIDAKANKNIIVENLNQFSYEKQKKILGLNFKGYNIVSIISWCEIVLQRIPIKFLASDDLIHLFSNVYSIKGFQVRLKRIADIFLSLIIIFLTFPLIVIFGSLIFIEDKGPIFYFQKRVGRNGNNFIICKLRTMNINAENNGVQWSKKGDLRVTRIGKFLRLTRIDELPQLFSVLIGDMSLIGPRPERPEIDLILKEKIAFYDLRYLVKPGLSGWAQVNYPYGSSINDSEVKLTYDFFYIKNFSFWLDLLIFFKTIRLVSRGEGTIPLH